MRLSICKYKHTFQNGICEKRLSSGVEPHHDEDLQMNNNALSVFMPTRRLRQIPPQENNEVSATGSTSNVQIEKLDVNCELNQGRILVTIQFLQPFNGVIYSKGFKDDPKCK